METAYGQARRIKAEQNASRRLAKKFHSIESKATLLLNSEWAELSTYEYKTIKELELTVRNLKVRREKGIR